jgi:Kdo2-lipid IVA lauroyltransferase/acyltransferase
VTDRLLAWAAAALFAALRLLGPRAASGIGGRVTRLLGPLTPWQRRVDANLRLAFPERDDAWRRARTREAWENLGRTACEYVHLPAIARGIESSAEADAAIERFRAETRPVLAFAAHLGNWELPAVVCRQHGTNAAILYRTPNNQRIAAMVRAMREPIMGRLVEARMTAPMHLAEALEEGLSVAMLLDQHFSRGPVVPFFGYGVQANPLMARLARRYEAPVYGIRVTRIEGTRFRFGLEGPLELPRDATGRVDVLGATAAMNAVIERWVRETPGQWLWMHRRWRDPLQAMPAPPAPAVPA